MKKALVLGPALAGALLVTAPAGPTPASAASPVRVVASAALGGCAAPVIEGVGRSQGLEVTVETADPALPGDADLVVGDDDELTRVLEGGLADPRTAVDLGYVARPGRRPLVAVVALPAAARHRASAQRLLAALGQAPARHAFAQCQGTAAAMSVPGPQASAAGYAQEIVDWWLPACSLERNGYNDPREVLGGPDAVNLGGKDNYRGIMSMGQGGYVVVDMGLRFADRPGADVRVYQTTTGEPVTLYAADAATGPFTLVGWRRYCGVRTPGVFSNHCDFDLTEAGLGGARYLKIEDGEIYPCRAAGTITEGPDVDAVELLGP